MRRVLLLFLSSNLLLLGVGMAQLDVEASFGFARAVHVLPLPPSPIRGQPTKPVHQAYGEVRLRRPLSRRFSLLTQFQLAAEGAAATALWERKLTPGGSHTKFLWPEVRTIEFKVGPAVEFALTEVIGIVGGAYGSYRLRERVDPEIDSPYGSAKPTDLRATFGLRAHVMRWSAELMYERGFRESEGDIAITTATDAPLYTRYYRTSIRLGVGYVIRRAKNKQ